ncbi:Trichome birefringence-like family [Quillaja saponaria]|uniref:Trichome birefringence-like family n=1 Tax=Quillaja saponaria TaxID=32244 RepID=A0AAD7QIA7_QUISA|nr:Trichome birefringence-like family [Quillaja saponaria]
MGFLFKNFCSLAYAILFQFLFLHKSYACDFFSGTWVSDDTYPLYNTSNCPFISEEFDCQKNGRPDNLYLKYRWKPNDCTFPRFDGQDFLRRYKGKKILFVGDSLSFNQWQSLICMLHKIKKYLMSLIPLQDYGISVTLIRKQYFVDLVKENVGMVLKLDSIENGKEWIGYDLLIFNSWHWWTHKGKIQKWDYIQEGDKLVKDMDRLVAYKKGLTTWSKWVDSNVNPTITKVFFQGISPTHFNGEDWNEKSATCEGQTQPLNGSTYPAGLPPAVAVVKEVLANMTTHVPLLDITTLSQLRKDGHPTSYGSDGKEGNDCSHWCLAGVPDTWNELLYALLVTGQNITSI